MTPSDHPRAIFIDPVALRRPGAWHAVAAELRDTAPSCGSKRRATSRSGPSPATRTSSGCRATTSTSSTPAFRCSDPSPVRVPGVDRHRGRDPHPHGRRGARRPPGPGQRLVPAPRRGQAPGRHRGHRRRVRGQVPPAGGDLRLRPGHRRALHAPGHHEHLRRAGRGRADHAEAHPGHLRRRRPRVPGRPERPDGAGHRHHRPVRRVLHRADRGPPGPPDRRPGHGDRQRRGRRLPARQQRPALVLHDRGHGRPRHHLLRPVRRTRGTAAPPRPVGPAPGPARPGQQRRRRDDPVDLARARTSCAT